MFKSDINDRELQVAIKMSNWLLTDSQFYDELAQIESFSHSNLTGRQVAAILRDARYKDMEIVGYKTLYPYMWPFPKVKGYYTKNKPNKIHVNLRALKDMDIFDHVVNNIHEFLHSIGFTHKGNNKLKYNNLNSIPYRVGYLAGSFAKRKWFNVR